MAVSALWQNQYALSVRKGPLDLSDTVSAQPGTNRTDSASHSNVGVPTIRTATAVKYGGDGHFQSTNNTDGAVGKVIGIRHAESGTYQIFGMPVVGNPDFNTGQKFIEVDRADGWATVAAGGTGASNDIFLAGQSPNTSIEFSATNESLVHAASTFFQWGVKEGTTPAKKYITFPTSSDGSDPLYYGSFLKKMDVAGSAKSRLLSDAIGTSYRISVSNTEPMKIGLDLTGRILITNADVGGIDGATADADFTLDIGRNYLMQDCIFTYYDGSVHRVIPIESFSLNLATTPSFNQYNNMFPLNMVMGGYSAEGSIVIPAMAKGSSGIDHDTLQLVFADAGTTSGGVGAYVKPRQMGLYWGIINGTNPSLYTAAVGGGVAGGSMPADIVDERGLHILMNTIITDVSMGGDVESAITVSFRCVNTFNTTTPGTIDRHAVMLATKTVATSSWGYNATGETDANSYYNVQTA